MKTKLPQLELSSSFLNTHVWQTDADSSVALTFVSGNTRITQTITPESLSQLKDYIIFLKGVDLNYYWLFELVRDLHEKNKNKGENPFRVLAIRS